MRCTLQLSMLVLAAAASLATAAPLACFPQAASSPSIRPSGIRERAGDILLICFGGTPTAPGAAVPLVDITISLAPAIDITSRISHPGHSASEALLLFDEVQPAKQEPCAARATCELRGAVSGSSGINYADPDAAVNGRQRVRNVYQADEPSGSTLSFRGVPFDPPGDAAVRTVRLTNLFVNGSQLSVPPLGLVPVSANVTSTGGVTLNIAASPVGIAGAETSTTQQLLDASGNPGATVVLNRASGNNQPLASNPSANSAPDGQTFRVRLAELTPNTFRVRNGVNWTSLNSEPDLVPQDVPGALYTSETGFYNPEFPGTGNLKRAGLASRGTRVLVRFGNVPAGVKLFAPVRIGDASAPVALRMVYALTGGDSGSHFLPAIATSPVGGGIAPLSGCPASCEAVYEIVRSDSTALDNADIPVYVAFLPGAAAAATSNVRITLAPLSNQGTAAGQTAPRFAGFTDPAIDAFRLQ